MKLDPGFITHWKTELLIERLGSDAVVAVLRLWGNAQIRRQFTGLEINPRRLALETKWRGNPQDLFDTLTDPDAPWLDLDADGTYSIHDFGQHQRQVVALWENGAKGGRPRKVSPTPPSKEIHTHPLPLPLLGFEMEPNGFEKKPNGFSEGAAHAANLDEIHPTGTAKHLEILAEKVRALRPAWKLPLTYAEMRLLGECASTLDGLSENDWQAIGGYLSAKLPEGSAGWQPRSRAKFLESAPDVYSHAMQWHRKSQPSAPLRSKAAPPPTRTAEDEAALADFLKSRVPKKA